VNTSQPKLRSEKFDYDNDDDDDDDNNNNNNNNKCRGIHTTYSRSGVGNYLQTRPL